MISNRVVSCFSFWYPYKCAYNAIKSIYLSLYRGYSNHMIKKIESSPKGIISWIEAMLPGKHNKNVLLIIHNYLLVLYKGQTEYKIPSHMIKIISSFPINAPGKWKYGHSQVYFVSVVFQIQKIVHRIHVLQIPGWLSKDEPAIRWILQPGFHYRLSWPSSIHHLSQLVADALSINNRIVYSISLWNMQFLSFRNDSMPRVCSPLCRPEYFYSMFHIPANSLHHSQIFREWLACEMTVPYENKSRLYEFHHITIIWNMYITITIIIYPP